MVVASLVLVVIGLVGLLLPASPAYRRTAARQLARRVGAVVPAEQGPALEARTTRRTRAAAIGTVLAGLASGVWHHTAGGAAGTDYGSWVTLAAVFTCTAGGLAVAEIWRPGLAVPESPRTARASRPVLTDYVPDHVVALTWALFAVALGWVLLAVAVSRTPWFEPQTVQRAAAPAVGLVVLAGLTRAAVRRVLDAPQPARDEAELYWQDGLRASALSTLHVPVALVSTFVVVFVTRTLDDAASATAAATGVLGPGWVTALLVTGYVLQVAVVLLWLASVAGALVRRDTERTRFRYRLWSRPGHGPLLGEG